VSGVSNEREGVCVREIEKEDRGKGKGKGGGGGGTPPGPPGSPPK
jgi:hypothetical protein